MSFSFAESFTPSPERTERDIVTVHGLNGSNAAPWLESPTGQKWLDRELFEGTRSRVLVFSYSHDSIDEDIHSSVGVSRLAELLLEALTTTWRRESSEEFRRPLAFISQGYGGVIVKRAIYIASRNEERYGPLLEATFVLIFGTYYHRPLSHEDLVERYAAGFFGSLKNLQEESHDGKGVVRLANQTASTLMATNHLFLESGALLRFKLGNFFVVCSPGQGAPWDLDPVSGATGWASETIHRIITTESNPYPFRGNKGELPEFKKLLGVEFSGKGSWVVQPVKSGLEGLHRSINRMPPVSISRPTMAPDKVGRAMNFGDITPWLRGAGPRLLHLSNYLDQTVGLTDVVRYLQEKIGYPANYVPIFTFTFRKDDSRANTAKAAILSLAVQAAAYLIHGIADPSSESPSTREPLLDALRRPSFATEAAVDNLFQEVNRLVTAWHQTVVWVLWDVDKCSEKLPSLLDKVINCCRFSERKHCILLETGGEEGDKIAPIMERFGSEVVRQVKSEQRGGFGIARTLTIAEENKSNPTMSTRATTSTTTAAAAATASQKSGHAWGMAQLGEELERCFPEVAGSPVLHGVLTRWIQRSIEAGGSVILPTVSRLRQHSRASRPQGIVMLVLTTLSNEEWLHVVRLLRWVLHSRRPLSFSEACRALALEDAAEDAVPDRREGNGADSAKEDGARDDDGEGGAGGSTTRDPPPPTQQHIDFGQLILKSEESLCGLIRVQGHGIEFSHPTIPRLLLQQWEPMVAWSSPRTHLHILERLFQGLAAEAALAVRKGERSDLAPESSLSSYTASLWIEHYRLAADDEATAGPARSMLRKFLANEAAVRLCLHSAGGGPFSHGELLSPSLSLKFPRAAVLASAGLEMDDIGDLLERPDFRSDQDLVFAAVVGALTSNREPLIREVSGLISSFEPQRALFLLYQATRCDNPEILSVLYGSLPTGTKLPQAFVLAGAELGLSKMVRDACSGVVPTEELDLSLLLVRCLQSDQPEAFRAIVQVSRSKIKDSRTVMNAAARIGDRDAVKLARDLPRSSETLWEPLHTACKYGNHEAVEELLKRVASVEDLLLQGKEERSKAEDNSDEVDSLVAAIKAGHTECAAAILAQLDQDLDGYKGRLRDLLREALMSSQLESSRLLIVKYGVDLRPEAHDAFQDKGGFLPEIFADDKNVELALLLLDNWSDVDEVGWDKLSLLHQAARAGCVRLAETLIARGANVNCTDNTGVTPLYHACLQNRPRVVELLLRAGADPLISTTSRNWSPLEAAYDYPDCVELLVRNKKPPDFRRVTNDRYESYTALYLAARWGHTRTVDLLLEGDPDLEFQVMGYTPLTAAAAEGHTAAARSLLERGANVNHLVGEAQRHLIKLIDDEETLAVVLEFRPDLEVQGTEKVTVLNQRCANVPAVVTESFMRRLLNAGADMESEDWEGERPLGNSIFAKNSSLARLLISRGANVNGSGREKWGGPLHRACMTQDMDIIRLLVSKGADIHAVAARSGTPLQCAFTGKRQEEREVVGYLVGLGAEVNAKGCVYRGVAAQGCLEAHPDTVRYLAELGCEMLRDDAAGIPPFFIPCLRKNDSIEIIEYLRGRGAKLYVDKEDRGKEEGKVKEDGEKVEEQKREEQKGEEQKGEEQKGEEQKGEEGGGQGTSDEKEEKAGKAEEAEESEQDEQESGRDVMGRTILHCAVTSYNPELVRHLVEAEPALVRALDKDGWSPLHWSVRGAFLYHPERDDELTVDAQAQLEVVRLLLDRGCPGLEGTVTTGQGDSLREWTLPGLAAYWNAPDEIRELIGAEVAKLKGDGKEQPAAGKEATTDGQSREGGDEERKKKKEEEEEETDAAESKPDVQEDAAEAAGSTSADADQGGSGDGDDKATPDAAGDEATEKPEGGTSTAFRVASKRGGWTCDGCYCELRGILYQCGSDVCNGGYGLCLKCFRHKDRLHKEHSTLFKEVGDEYGED